MWDVQAFQASSHGSSVALFRGNKRRTFLGDHDGWRIGVAGCDRGEDGCINDAKRLRAVDLAVRGRNVPSVA